MLFVSIDLIGSSSAKITFHRTFSWIWLIQLLHVRATDVKSIIRVMLSGFTDLDAVLYAVNTVAFVG